MPLFNDDPDDYKDIKCITRSKLCFIYALKYGFLRDFRDYFRNKNHFLFEIVWALAISI